jgi:hypothetical protein
MAMAEITPVSLFSTETRVVLAQPHYDHIQCPRSMTRQCNTDIANTAVNDASINVLGNDTDADSNVDGDIGDGSGTGSAIVVTAP